MDKYVNIYYNKLDKTQRFVLVPGHMCANKANAILTLMNIEFTNFNFIGKYEPTIDFVNKTYKYAKKWRWLNTIDLTKKGL